MNKNIIISVFALAMVLVSAATSAKSKTQNANATAVTKVTDTPEKQEFKAFDVRKDFQGNPFTWFKGAGLCSQPATKADSTK
jgi:hypothetical protein